TQVNQGNVQGKLRQDDLHGLAIDLRKTGAEALMPRDDFIDRGPQGSNIQIAAKTQSLRDVVLRASPFKLVDEPQTLLRKRNRQMFGTRLRTGQLLFLKCAELSRKLRDCRCIKE